MDKLVHSYRETITQSEWKEGGLQRALQAGSDLLLAAGGVTPAATALRLAGLEQLGDHFAGLQSSTKTSPRSPDS